MNNDSLRILQFFDIINDIASYCKTHNGKEKFLNLNFFYNENDLNNEFDIVDEFYFSKVKGYFFNIINLDSFESIFKKIEIGEIPEINEFKKIYDLIYQSKNFENYFKKYNKEFSKFIQNYNIKFYDFLELINLFNKIFDNDFNIKDSASERLKEIRIKIKENEKRLRNLIDSYFKRNDLKDILSADSFIIKNNKFLIPVKSNFKSKINGIISDVSSTGKTFFIETFDMIELNNKIFSLKSEELVEIYKILRELSLEINKKIEYIKDFLNYYSLVDYYSAKVQYFYDKKWERAYISENEITLNQCFHPFLKDPVKNNIRFSKEKPIVIISGPNTGGKTVMIKTIGLISLLFQAGMYIPSGYGSKIPIFNDVFIDCGDEQSIDKSLSTFSSHLYKINNIIKSSTKDSLVLIDEIGTGTSPEEGEALSLAIIDKMKEKDCFTIISSHFEKIKTLGIKDEKILICSLRFDYQNLKPLFIFQQNTFGQSFALEVAKNLGFDEEIINKAKKILSRKFDTFLIYKVENILNEYNEKLKELKEIKAKYEKELSELENLKEKYNKNYNEIKNDIIQKFYEEFKIFRKEIENEISILKNKGYNKEDSKRITEKLNQFLERKLNNFENNYDIIQKKLELLKNREENKNINDKKFNKEISIGSFVKLRDTQAVGKVIEIKKDKVKVNINNIIFETVKENLQIVDYNEKVENQIYFNIESNIKFEIDLRGLKVFEAEAKLDDYLDKALLSNYEKVYIIHGKGDGILSKFVHDYLKGKEFVKSFSFAPIEEGGNGCTIVYLK